MKMLGVTQMLSFILGDRDQEEFIDKTGLECVDYNDELFDT